MDKRHLPSLLPSSHMAARWAGMGTSIFSEMTQLANLHKAINLGQGFPDFHGYQPLLEQISRQTLACHNQYAPSAGEPSCRRAVSQFIEHQTGLSYDPEHEVTITNGATEALFCAINAFVGPKDRVLIFEPAFDVYAQAIASAGAIPVCVPLHAPDTPAGLENHGRWAVDWHQFDSICAGGFSLVILNSPHNPTGKVFNEDELWRITQKALENKALIITDEVYENLVYDQTPFVSVASFPEAAHAVIRVSSAAKTFGFTGLKIGWVCAPRALTDAIRIVHQATVFCVNPAVQLGLADALAQTDHIDSYLQSQQQNYSQKKQLLAASLQQAGYLVGPCEGTFFLAAQYENLRPDMDSLSYSRFLVAEKQVAVIPMSAFYQTPPRSLPWVRFAFCKQEETLRRAALALR